VPKTLLLPLAFDAPPAPTVTVVDVVKVIFDSALAPPPEFSPVTLER
jgi:hypothetical protein